MDKFSVYNHEFTLPTGEIARRNLIVIKHDNGLLTFTDFGKHIRSKRMVTKPSEDCGKQFYFVVKMLNYAFQKKDIKRLSDLSIDIVGEFLEHYAKGTLEEDTKPRNEATVDACLNAMLSFMSSLAQDEELKVNFSLDDLVQTEIYRTKNNEICERKIPVFNVVGNSRDNAILRDIPNKVFSIMLDHIANEHPELLGLVMLQAFAGLRPGEACNVRREDSPLGPGFLFTIVDGKTTKIEIDIRKELYLRSDHKKVGFIKRERMARVPAVFIDSFKAIYEQYMKYMKDEPIEKEYMPFSTNISGKAITYPTYYMAFSNIMKNEIAPICLNSDDPEIVSYGRILMEYKLSPHALRHWYSVQLTLAGYSAPELMHARGDKSIESALTYIENKGELEKAYTTVTNEMFDFMSWAAEKRYGI